MHSNIYFIGGRTWCRLSSWFTRTSILMSISVVLSTAYCILLTSTIPHLTPFLESFLGIPIHIYNRVIPLLSTRHTSRETQCDIRYSTHSSCSTLQIRVDCLLWSLFACVMFDIAPFWSLFTCVMFDFAPFWSRHVWSVDFAFLSEVKRTDLKWLGFPIS